MDGITKVINELGRIILSKEDEIQLKQEEIDKLKNRVELIEKYLDVYEEFYKKEKNTYGNSDKSRAKQKE